MKRIEPTPGIEIAIMTFLVLGGILIGVGLSTTVFIPFILGALFVLLGVVALFGLADIRRAGQRR